MEKEGQHIRLIPFKKEFGDKICEWFYDYNYRLFFREFENLLTLSECQQFDFVMKKSGVDILMIVEKNNPEIPIGIFTYSWINHPCGVSRIGIMLDKQFQHKTFCIESLIVGIDFLVEHLNVKKCVVEFLAEDIHIKKITEQGGFKYEATLFKEAFVDNQYKDVLRYCMFKEEFFKCRGIFLKLNE